MEACTPAIEGGGSQKSSARAQSEEGRLVLRIDLQTVEKAAATRLKPAFSSLARLNGASFACSTTTTCHEEGR